MLWENFKKFDVKFELTPLLTEKQVENKPHLLFLTSQLVCL